MGSVDISKLRPGSVEIKKYVADLLCVPFESVVEISDWTRLYSRGWTVSLDDSHCGQRYFIKQFSSPEGAERQAQLMQRADALFNGDLHYVPVECRHVPDFNIVITRDVRLPCLYNLLAFSLHRNPFRWYLDACRAMELSGRWLRQFHGSNGITGSPVPALSRYAKKRGDILGALPHNICEDLTKALEMCPEGIITVVHSDFNGWNILTDGRRLSVIDHGISEWVEMSPAWDLASFIASFRAFAQENMRTPIHWFPMMMTRLERVFLDSYGDSAVTRSYTFAVCVALRHAFSYLKLKEQNASRARWHMTNVRWWLAEAHKRVKEASELRLFN